MAITTASQSQLGQDTAKNSQVVTTVIKNFNSGTLGSGPSITSVIITDSNYNNLDDTAVTTSNGYIKIIGTGFTSTANVYVGSNAVPAANVTFVSSTEIRARVPVLSAGNYSLSLFNSNSSGAISSSTFIVSTGPAWVTGATLANQASGTAFNVSLSATSDSSVTYSNTTALPAGTTLAANGYFSGTVTTGSETTFSFDVKATDAENQDNTRTFSVTVTVTPQGALYAWGNNGTGSTGLNKTTTVFSPTQVGSDVNWSDVGADNQSFGIKINGTLWAWGRGSAGQLGLNDTNYRSSPTQVGTGTNWSKISSGSNGATALKTDGTLWTWGSNNDGQLGTNNNESRSSPVQVGTSTNWSQIPNHFYFHRGAIKTDGTLWLWGTNYYGLGTNDTIFRSSPTQVGATTNWRAVSTGRWQTLATKTDGTLWAWGLGRMSPLNNSVNTSSPVQVGSGTDWDLAVVGQYSALATKTNGTLWSWGNNSNGQGGLNTAGTGNYRSSPTQVGTNTNWKLIDVGTYQSLATKTDGTLWFWGTGSATPFGNQTSRSSPTQVGSGTTWLIISIGSAYTGLVVSST
jgi:alpha-tubulin suppressor-like RCC1 family protein